MNVHKPTVIHMKAMRSKAHNFLDMSSTEYIQICTRISNFYIDYAHTGRTPFSMSNLPQLILLIRRTKHTIIPERRSRIRRQHLINQPRHISKKVRRPSLPRLPGRLSIRRPRRTGIMKESVHDTGNTLDSGNEELILEGEEVLVEGFHFGEIVEGPVWVRGVAVAGGLEVGAFQAVDFGGDADEVLARVEDYG